MSVMLEALRRAERQAQGGAWSAAAGAREHAANVARTGLSLEPLERTVPGETAPLQETRIGGEEPNPASGATQAVGTAAGATSDARRPFHVAIALLGGAALAATAYFWLQLQPPSSSATNPPARPVADAKPLAATDPAPAAVAIPGLPLESPERPVSRAATATAPPAANPPTAMAMKPAAEMPLAQSMLPPRRAEFRIHAQVEAGYAAFQKGDIDAAHDAYRRALDAEPYSRDALLGMAAVEMRLQRSELAEAHYRRLLQIHPADPHAQAGILALRAERVDPLRAESRLKTLLAENPEATALYFALGNQLARQGRWADARQAYVQALSGDEGDPDIAFNLAVSLDQLHQSAEAREHYVRALALAERRRASFPVEAAQLRLQQLGR